MGELLALLALISFSGNIIITKIASGRLSINLGFLVSVSVNVIFAALLLGIQSLYRQEPIQWNNVGVLIFLLSGFFSTYLGRWFFFDSIVKLGPAKASIFQVSNPLFTIVIAWIFLSEALTLADTAAAITILSGLFLVSYVPQAFSKEEVKEDLAIDSLLESSGSKAGALKRVDLKSLVRSGIFLGLMGAVSYAVGNVLRGVAVEEWNEPIAGGLLGALVGVVLHFSTNVNTRSFLNQLIDADRKGLLLYVVSGILTIIGQISVIASMWYIPISIANLITVSTPVLVIPLSYFLLRNREGITFRTILGAALVLLGIGAILLT